MVANYVGPKKHAQGRRRKLGNTRGSQGDHSGNKHRTHVRRLPQLHIYKKKKNRKGREKGGPRRLLSSIGRRRKSGNSKKPGIHGESNKLRLGYDQ